MNTQVTIKTQPEELEEWNEIVEDTDMNRSEWIRYMIRAGRRQVAELDPRTNDTDDPLQIRDRVLNTFDDHDDHLPPDEIVDAVLTPIEDRTLEAIRELDDEDRIAYNPAEGGYEQNEHQ